MRIGFGTALLWAILPGLTLADDWPQWLGEQRDAVWRELGVLERIPAAGLPVQWRAPVELGYSGPAVAAGRVYVMDYVRREGEIRNNPGARDRLQGTERVLCFDAGNGKLLWKHQYDRPYHVSFGGGPRCTPTVDGDRVNALGAEGNLWCLAAQDGKVLWSKDFAKEYKAETPMWGVAAHPLVDGNRLFCVVGGEGSVAVAFDKITGREVWRSLSASEQGYCPPTMIEQGGIRQLLIWHGEAINALDPESGRPYWSVPLQPSFGMSITTPRKLDAHLFVSGFGNAGVLLKLAESKPAAEIVWRGQAKTALYGGTSTPFLESGTIYGCDANSGALMAASMKDGQRLWETTQPTLGERRGRYGTAFLVKHAERFFLFSETGDLILARLSPQRYKELSRTHVIDPTNKVFGRSVVWSHPAFAQRCLFVRNDKELLCVSLAP